MVPTCKPARIYNPRRHGVYHPLTSRLNDPPPEVPKTISFGNRSLPNRRWRDPGGYRSPWKSRVNQPCIRKDKYKLYYKPGDAQGDYRNNHRVSDTRSGWQPKLRSPRRRVQRQTKLSKTQTPNPAWKSPPRRRATNLAELPLKPSIILNAAVLTS